VLVWLGVGGGAFGQLPFLVHGPVPLDASSPEQDTTEWTSMASKTASAPRFHELFLSDRCIERLCQVRGLVWTREMRAMRTIRYGQLH
jgi:hypothetical protein